MLHRLAPFAFAGALGALILATTPSISLAHYPHHSIGQRMHNQQHRIYQGVRQDQISPSEYRSLEREERGIARERYRFRHDDGHLGPVERARLQQDLNEASRDIHQDRHN
jgi:hypothetical protein